MKRMISTLLLTITFKLTALFNFLPGYETRWDWKEIALNTNGYAVNQLTELKSIQWWGAATSDLQTCGLDTAGYPPVENNWTLWEETKKRPQHMRINSGCDSYTKYKEDVACLKKAGLNCYRFSIEWSKVEPEKGVFNRDALQYYIDLINELIANNIKPIPTLFHHAWPLWFESPEDQTQGRAFEDKRNIEDFVDFAEYVFINLVENVQDPSKLNTWLTFNEPVAYAMAAYIDGKCPPGKKFNMITCGHVVKNMLDAHCAIYDRFTALNHTYNLPLQIGIVKLFNPIQPYNPLNPLDQMASKLFDNILHTPTLEYFTTGHFNWLQLITDYNPDVPSKLDFIGLNYYTHTLIKSMSTNPGPAFRPDELPNFVDHDYPKTIYAEGFYDSIKRAAEVGKPIWITENGFDTDQPEMRDLYLKRHLYTLNKAIKDGYDIQAYLFWTLVDCYSWNKGITTHGIFDGQRQLKPDVAYLIKTIQFARA